MTKEESIALAEKLQKNYANLDALKDQINRNESEIKSRSLNRITGHSYFKFFWPTLIIVVVLYILIGVIHNLGFRYASDSVQYTLMNLRLLLPFAALVAGAIIAGVKKHNNMSEVEVAERSAQETITKLQKANEDNRNKILRIEEELDDYSSLVPARARSKTAMFKVASMLKTGKAEDFEDAISKIR